MVKRSHLLLLLIAVVVVIALAMNRQMIEDCGWGSLWLGKNAGTAWLLGYCSNGEIHIP